MSVKLSRPSKPKQGSNSNPTGGGQLKPIDQLKRESSVSLRALGQLPNTEITFSNQEAGVKPDQIRLPVPTSRITKDPELHRLYRGRVDQIAVRHAFHNHQLHQRLKPKQPLAAQLYDALEETRLEAAGGSNRAGIAANLNAFFNHQLGEEGKLSQQVASQENLPLALRLLTRQRLSGQTPPPQLDRLLKGWRDQLPDSLDQLIDRLQDQIHDQSAFGEAAKELLRELQYHSNSEGEEESPEDNDSEQDSESDGDNQIRGEQDMEEDSFQDMQPQSDDQGEQEGQEDGDALEDMDDSEGLDLDQTPDEPGGEPHEWRPEHDLTTVAKEKFYHAYRTDYDEIVEPHDLCELQELLLLRQALDEHLVNLQSVVAKLANRLQRKLLAQQQRGWEFDLEDGYLDSAKLARVIIDPSSPLSYKWERDTDFKDTIVTLLIDNSGSMRGRPITIAAVCADILARTLERCGVKSEILGFTTVAWKGGQSRERWVEAGKPVSPGRLNDLRHIIYKPADVPYRRARTNLGLMLREGLLKENIDGEALLWAHQRLLARKEDRRILMVISDGAPVDDSTLSVNEGNYLERHLRDVIADIEGHSTIELVAIGIGHDVSRYYQHAVTIVDVNQLGGAITDQLADLFARSI